LKQQATNLLEKIKRIIAYREASDFLIVLLWAARQFSASYIHGLSSAEIRLVHWNLICWHC